MPEATTTATTTAATGATRPTIASGAAGGRPEISVVVPVSNQAESVEALVQEIDAALSGRAYEMIFVDDSSIDDTRARLHALKPRFSSLRLLGHRKAAGQSRAVRTGVTAARSNVVATLEGDGQNDPSDIAGLITQLNRAEAPPRLGLVQGLRKGRKGGLLGNLRAAITKNASRDDACLARAFRRDAYLQLPYFDHMHRYLPALMTADGFDVETRPVNHRPRPGIRSDGAGLGGFAEGFSDFRGVMWLRRRRRSPGGIDEI